MWRLKKEISYKSKIKPRGKVPKKAAIDEKIEKKTLKEMSLGSVIIDLAGASGGNTEGGKLGEEIVVENVTISSPINLPSLVAFDASSLYSKNIYSFSFIFTIVSLISFYSSELSRTINC